MADPTKARLRELFEYDAEAGHLVWRTRSVEDFGSLQAWSAWNAHFPGTVAGDINRQGYRRMVIDGKRRQAHRMIWIFANGDIPDGIQIDHINGVRSDNRLTNLRLVTNAENQRNRSMRSDNTSGFPGVSWNKRDSKWVAQMGINGRAKNLGSFDTIEEAAAARAEANRQFGFHANHGKTLLAKAEGSSHA